MDCETSPNQSALNGDAREGYESWLESYLNADSDSDEFREGISLTVELDELNYNEIEKRVQELTQRAVIFDGFCSECHHLLRHWPDVDGKWEASVGRLFHTEEIEAAARAGCKFCAFLWSRFCIENLIATYRKIEARLASMKHPAKCSLSIQCRHWIGRPTLGNIHWVNLPGKESTYGTSDRSQFVGYSYPLRAKDKLLEDPVDPVKLMKSWLSECSESHTCYHTDRKYEWPTRLLLISDEDTVELVETASWETLPRYATLSYCWGNIPFTKLTPETYTEFLKGVRLENLPKTFRDAIFYARNLELTYIWIDALCIIQEQQDSSDWLKESSRMRSVYGGSHVTLAASTAANVHEGFPTPLVRTKYSCGFAATITTSQSSRVQCFFDPESYEDASMRTLLASRAWALQEKLLSPRTINFGDFGAFWECQLCTRNQFLPGDDPEKHGNYFRSPQDGSWIWSEVVFAYTKAALTYDSDRLPALSGIAERQHEAKKDEYLAGLWREGLEISLLWGLKEPYARQARPEWRAPTWSWASIHGRCHFYGHSYMEGVWVLSRVMDAWTRTAEQDPFGAVMDGEVTLACSLLVRVSLHLDGLEGLGDADAEMRDPQDRPHVLVDDQDAKPLPVSLDYLVEQPSSGNEQVFLLPFMEGLSGYTIGKAQPGVRTVDFKAHFASPDTTWERVIQGLVLRAAPEAPSRFHRLGSFDFSNIPCFHRYLKDDRIPNRDFYHEFLPVMQERGEATAAEMCGRMIPSEEHPTQKYVVTIK